MSDERSFATERGFLLQLAYRMLGSRQDAEDAVQDVWLRWREVDAAQVQVPRAWLTRVCTRLCIDRLRAAERGPAAYPGEWLPEPWVDTAHRRESDETLAVALLATLRRLPATERAVFLLHDVFGYPFTDVGAMLDLDATHCRQLAVRAREHLGGPPRLATSAQQVERLGAAFFAALRDGDIEPLRGLLHEDVVLRADGGGKVSAVHYPLRGRLRLLRFFDRLFVRPRLLADLVVEAAWWNGAPGFLLRDGAGRIDSAYQFEVAGEQITAIFVQRNPDKLHAFVAAGPATPRSSPGEQPHA